MVQYLHYRVRITIQDGRQVVGKFLAFDKHMNLVLADAEEQRKVRAKKSKDEREEKRALGLLIVRGEEVVSMSIEGPPPIDESRTRATQATAVGPGVGRAAGRAVSAAPTTQAPAGLVGPVRGVGGPAAAMMQPGRGAGMGPPPGMPYGAPGMPPPGMAGMMPPPGMGRAPPGMPGMPPGMPPYGAPGMPPGMQFPPPGMGRAPPGMPPGMSPYGMPPGMPPPGMGRAPPGMPPPGMPLGMPPGMPPPGMGRAPPGMPPGMPPPGMAPPGRGAPQPPR